MVLRYNKPSKAKHRKWCIAGGTKEGKESPLETLSRELKEELNIPEKMTTKQSTFIKTCFVRNNLISLDYALHVFFMEIQDDVEKFNKTIKLSKEHSEWKWVNFKEFQKLESCDGQNEVLKCCALYNSA